MEQEIQETMANAVLEGAKGKGADAVLFTSAEFDVSMMDAYDAVAFGCPAMGDEVLEESEFEPMFSSCESKAPGKRLPCLDPMDGETESG